MFSAQIHLPQHPVSHRCLILVVLVNLMNAQKLSAMTCDPWCITQKRIHKLANHSSGTFIHSRPKAVADGCGSHWPATVSFSLPHLVFVASYINICIIFAPNEPKSQLLLLIIIASVHYVSKLFPCFFPCVFPYFSWFLKFPMFSENFPPSDRGWRQLRQSAQVASTSPPWARPGWISPFSRDLLVGGFKHGIYVHNILGIIIPSNWLFFSEGLKPPTSYHLTIHIWDVILPIEELIFFKVVKTC